MRCFLVVGTPIWNPGYVGSIFRRSVVCRRVCGFIVWAFLAYVQDFVIVLFPSGVFEHVLFYVRVVIVTRLYFG